VRRAIESLLTVMGAAMALFMLACIGSLFVSWCLGLWKEVTDDPLKGLGEWPDDQRPEGGGW
jgi:hypothetical protein